MQDAPGTGAERILLVLASLARRGKAMSVRELAGETGLAQSTLYRQIALLKRWGFVSEDGGRYAPGPVSLQLALSFDLGSHLVDASRGAMQRLAHASGESVGLVVAVKEQVICLEMIESLHSLRCSFEKGRAVPLRAGASAKSLLAFMNERRCAQILDAMFADDPSGRLALTDQLATIREHGYVVSDSEVDPGVWGVSAPIFARSARASESVASITLMVPVTRVPGREAMLIDATRSSAREISRRLQSD
ncbi:IclR family transcriptional regulator [Trinickia dabaoshanensis]|uniref:IclR family transcriptional regulator n=1 Tax=Trinickia dabaoshanensis TaxID=564714 RepID=A0A2N7VZX1_9BURK|nr:IclR family transcriptional regulator [Trinickia dabaoshanensis]PMS22712.1 IclR family transcriptional regulator [Trinickia dabaoshanensis]